MISTLQLPSKPAASAAPRSPAPAQPIKRAAKSPIFKARAMAATPVICDRPAIKYLQGKNPQKKGKSGDRHSPGGPKGAFGAAAKAWLQGPAASAITPPFT